MHHVRVPVFAICACLAIVACDKRDPVLPEARATAGLPTVEERAPSASGEPHGDATVPAKPLPPAATAIPASLQGRWGLTPADCTSTRGDAKGLLIVSGDRLAFYESRAVPTGDAQSSADSVSGHFTFTGEGQTWTKYQALKLQQRKLVRTEANPTASFTYAKCD